MGNVSSSKKKDLKSHSVTSFPESMSSSGDTPSPVPKKWTAHLDEIFTEKKQDPMGSGTISGSLSSSGDTPSPLPKKITAHLNFVFKKKLSSVIKKTSESDLSETVTESIHSTPSTEQSEASEKNNNAEDDMKKSTVCAFFRRARMTFTKRSNKIFPVEEEIMGNVSSSEKKDLKSNSAVSLPVSLSSPGDTHSPVKIEPDSLGCTSETAPEIVFSVFDHMNEQGVSSQCDLSETENESIHSTPSIEESEASDKNNNAADDGTKVKKSTVGAFFRRARKSVKKTFTKRSNKIFPA